MSPIVLIDMDGVVCDYTRRILELAHTRLGLPLFTPEEILLFDTEKIFEEEYRDAVNALSEEKGFFASLSPISGAVEAVKEIRDVVQCMGGEVFICTAPKKPMSNPYCAQEKIKWLIEYLGNDFASGAIVTRDKTLVHGDILVDDKPEITGVCVPTWEQIHYAQPYNTGFSQKRLTWSSWRNVLIPVLQKKYPALESSLCC